MKEFFTFATYKSILTIDFPQSGCDFYVVVPQLFDTPKRLCLIYKPGALTGPGEYLGVSHKLYKDDCLSLAILSHLSASS